MPVLFGPVNGVTKLIEIPEASCLNMQKFMEVDEAYCRLVIIFGGRVQGVGFRFTVADLAARREVVGFVRNESDGSVYVEVEGRKPELERLVQDIVRSPVGPGIRHEHQEWKEATGAYKRFEIRYR